MILTFLFPIFILVTVVVVYRCGVKPKAIMATSGLLALSLAVSFSFKETMEIGRHMEFAGWKVGGVIGLFIFITTLMSLMIGVMIWGWGSSPTNRAKTKEAAPPNTS